MYMYVCVCVCVCVFNQRFLNKYFCDGKLTKIPKRDFIFARVKTGQVGTWSPTEISPVQSSSLSHIRTGILHEGII